MSTKKSIKTLAFWVGLAILFNIGIYVFMGSEKALSFLGGYIIEQSLSLDNLFLFILVFEGFSIKPEYQKKILTYGIWGAIILRLIFVMLGVTVVNQFHWMLYIFGFILIISGIKMFKENDSTANIKDSKLLKLINKIFPVSEKFEGEKFFVKKDKKLYLTPLFVVLLLIEGSDIIFAIDSIPAIFSITTDPFIVYTSNIFAILGLRSMYFLLYKLHEKFAYIKYGIASILVFTGIKLVVLIFNIHISVLASLLIIFSILTVSVIASIIANNKKNKDLSLNSSEENRNII